MDAVNRIILDPKYHDVLTLVKGVRNGIVYGTKVRFPHALVFVPVLSPRLLPSPLDLPTQKSQEISS
jgi:hypothetical protein